MSMRLTRPRGLALEAEGFTRAAASADAEEGISAFVEKTRCTIHG